MEKEPSPEITHKSKYFLFIAILFVAVLMISNTTAGKIIQIGSFTVSGAIIIFPISYIFGDVLTEVYGYKASRRIIWSGFGALVLMSLCYWIIQLLPPANFWQNQKAYEIILGNVPRITLGSIIAYFAGEFSNSFVLSKMKVWMKGRFLWVRTIGSTIVGEGVDSTLVIIIAFAGVVPNSALLPIIFSGYILKVLYEIIATPITYFIVKRLKRTEGIDVYDKGISYNPFTLKE